MTYSSPTEFPGYAAFLPTVGAALVIARRVGGSYPEGRRPAPSVPPRRRYIGDRSYTFYLWHWPFLVIAAAYAGHSLSVGTNLLWLAAAFGLSIITYALIERPIRHAEWGMRVQALVPWVASVAAVIVLATAYVGSINNREARQSFRAANAAAPVLAVAPQSSAATTAAKSLVAGSATEVSQTLPAVVSEVSADGNGRRLPAVLDPSLGQLLNDHPNLPNCLAHDGQTTQTPCHFGAPSSHRTLLVLGDSHAEMWIPALEALGQKEGWDVVPLMKSACSPGLWVGSAGTADCHAWFRWALRVGSKLHPDVTLIAGHYDYRGSVDNTSYNQLIVNGMNAAINGLKKASKAVVILGDAPGRAKQPVDCLLASHATPAGCSESLAPSEPDTTSLIAQTAAGNHVGFIDTTGWFCSQNNCPLVVGNLIAYRDDNHVTQTYAKALSSAFQTAFDAASKLGKQPA